MAKVKIYCRRTNPRLWWHFVMWYLEWNSNDLDETEWTESKVYDFIEEWEAIVLTKYGVTFAEHSPTEVEGKQLLNNFWRKK